MRETMGGQGASSDEAGEWRNGRRVPMRCPRGETVDTIGLGPIARKSMRVQILPGAPYRDGRKTVEVQILSRPPYRDDAHALSASGGLLLPTKFTAPSGLKIWGQ